MPPIRVLMVTAEAYPLAKTGGLGDAVTGMALAMGTAGQDVQVLLPAYPGVVDGLSRARTVARLPDLPGGPATLVRGHCRSSGLRVLALCNDALYDRVSPYVDGEGKEHPDNALRFAALSHAASCIAQGLPGLDAPHVVHAHDWHAGLVPLLMHAAGVRGVRTVLTLHNMAFQGAFDMAWADAIHLPRIYRNTQHAVAWDRLNFLKAGILHADRVTTVSHHYAQEILTPAFGCGLDSVLASRGDALIAIPNGIDAHEWDPARDPALGEDRYSARDTRPKTRCKAVLQHAFGLHATEDSVILALGSRLTHQKMADVAVQALPRALDAHPRLQVAAIGCGDPAMEAALAELAQRYPGRCGVHIGYDETLAHRLHAGADILLHGSRFEPFGLTPLYAMRYGTIPIGSRVGGMVDTIRDPGQEAPLEAMRCATGVLFEGDSVDAMTAAIDRTLCLQQRPALWRAIQRNAMTANFSWDHAVERYAALYRDLVGDLAEAVAPRVAARPKPSSLLALPAPGLADDAIPAAA